MNLTGPQSDRDLLWQRSQQSQGRTPNNEEFGTEAAKLRSENGALRDQLQRALKELKSYQATYPSPFAPNDSDESPQLTASPEITSALFEAYDTRINELQDTVRQLNAKITTLRENAELLIQENEDLRSTHLDGVRSSIAGKGARLDPNAPLTAEIIADLHEQIDVLRGENNLLMEQRSVLMTELEGHQGELERKAAEMAQLTQQLFAAVSDVQTLSKRAEQAEKDRDAAATQALSYSDVLGKAEVDQEALSEQVSMLQQRLKESEDLVQEYKKQLRSVASKGEDDSSQSMKRVQDAENRVRELHGSLFSRTQELDAASEVIRKLRSEYQTTRQDAEGMLQVMGGLERQLNEYAAREAEVSKREQETREREEEVLTFREQCAARDDQNKKEIERLLAERKLISLRRKDEIEKAMEQTRRAMGEQITALEKEIDHLAERNAKLIFDAEKAGRDGRSAEELLRRVQRLHEEEQRAVQAALKDVTERLDSVTKVKEQEVAKRSDAQDQVKELRVGAEKLRITIDELRSQISQADRTHEGALTALKASLRDAQKELADKTRLVAKKSKDLDDTRATLSEQVASLEHKQQEESALNQRRVAEAERCVRDFEAANFAAEQRTHTSIEQLKEKYAATASLLDSRLKRETDIAKGLSIKLRQSESVIADLLDEKAALARMVEDAQMDVRQQESELLACRSTIADLAAQLSSSHQAREDGAFKAARTMEELQLGAGGSSPARRSFGEFKDASVRFSVESLRSEDPF